MLAKCRLQFGLYVLVLSLFAAGIPAGEAPAETPATTAPAEAAEEQKSVAAQLVEEGWQKVRVAYWDKAIRKFEAVAEAADATDEDRSAALYGLAHCWQYRNLGADLDQARDHYREITEKYVGTRAEPYALMELARIHDLPLLEADREQDKAAAIYRQIIDRFPDHVLADEATLWLGVYHLSQVDQPAENEKGIKLFLDHLERRPDNVLAASMLGLIGGYHLSRGVEEDSDEQFRQALAYYERAEKVGLPTIRIRSSNCFRAARICERRLKDYAAAIKWYRIIVDEIPDDRWSYVSKMAIERCERLLAGEEPGDG